MIDTSKETSFFNTLIFKNIPRGIQDLNEFLDNLQIPPIHIKNFGRKRALLTFESVEKTNHALLMLKDLQIEGKYLSISVFSKEKPIVTATTSKAARETNKCNKAVQTGKAKNIGLESTATANKYVQKLYAIEGNLNFNQPPPPYIKYQYPKLNDDILNNICKALRGNEKFYTQVLHLMNRMNLEPPFQEKKLNLEDGQCLNKTISTQTELSTFFEDDFETEIDSDDGNAQLNKTICSFKRKKPPTEDQFKKKARHILQTTLKFGKDLKKINISNVNPKDKIDFDSSEKHSRTSKIVLKIKPTSLDTIDGTLSENSKASTLPTPNLDEFHTLRPDEMEKFKIKPTSLDTIGGTLSENSKASTLQTPNLDEFHTLSPDEMEKFPSRTSKIVVKIKPKPLDSIDGTSSQNSKAYTLPTPNLHEFHTLSPDEMEKLPIFKNYTKGEPSGKLYIKNLQKDIVAADLNSLYKRFIPDSGVSLDIKVMQHGRMKGQAFVTFSSETIGPQALQDLATEALISTNGLVLHEKPIVVSFGKQSM